MENSVNNIVIKTRTQTKKNGIFKLSIISIRNWEYWKKPADYIRTSDWISTYSSNRF